jgi:hypothetical protein
VVVLGDLTIDLEVSAKLPPVPGATASVSRTHLVQREARGTTFSGRYPPSRRLAGKAQGRLTSTGGDVDVDGLVFNFSNAFSWFTAKEIELITVRDDYDTPQPLDPLILAPTHEYTTASALAESQCPESVLNSMVEPDVFEEEVDRTTYCCPRAMDAPCDNDDENEPELPHSYVPEQDMAAPWPQPHKIDYYAQAHEEVAVDDPFQMEEAHVACDEAAIFEEEVDEEEERRQRAREKARRMGRGV